MTWEQMRARLRMRREGLGFSQRYVADLIGTRQATISDWETGVYTPTVPNLVVWCRALDLDVALNPRVTGVVATKQ